MGSGPNDGGARRKHPLSAIEASLRRLQTDYIDLYQVQVFDDATPIEETLAHLEYNLAAADAPLEPAHADRLTAVSDLAKPYPFGLLERFNRR